MRQAKLAWRESEFGDKYTELVVVDESGTELEILGRDGASDCPEDNFLFRSYSWVTDLANRMLTAEGKLAHEDELTRMCNGTY